MDGEIPGYFPLLVPDIVELGTEVARPAVNTDGSAGKVHVPASEAHLSVVFTARGTKCMECTSVLLL